VFFAQTDTREVLNDYFIPVTVDSTTDEGHEYWFMRLQTQLRAKYPYVMGPCAWVVTPDGTPLRVFDVKTVQHRPDYTVKELRAVVAEQHLKKGAPLPFNIPDTLKAAKADDTILHVNARFLVDDALNSLDSRVSCLLNMAPVAPNPAPVLPLPILFKIRSLSPVDEWLTLTAEQRQELLPPASTGSGRSYKVPEATSAIIFRHLCPPTFNARLDGSVFENQMTGRVARVGKETEVELRGHFAEQHHIWGSPDNNLAEGDVLGYVRFDTATRIITKIGLTTDPGVYGDRVGFRVPFSATVELWKADPDHPAVGLLRPE
jgi:hypothetical protein